MATQEELGKLTKAELIELLKNTAQGITARQLLAAVIIEDGAGGETELDVKTGHFSNRAMGREIDNGVVVEGDGNKLRVNLSTLYMYGGDVIEYDPAPDATPIKLTFSTEE